MCADFHGRLPCEILATQAGVTTLDTMRHGGNAAMTRNACFAIFPFLINSMKAYPWVLDFFFSNGLSVMRATTAASGSDACHTWIRLARKILQFLMLRIRNMV